MPAVWHWRDLRPQAMRAAELVGTEQAERRVLRLHNPGPRASASNLVQHPDRHARRDRPRPSPFAVGVRLIIEGQVATRW